MRWELEEMGAGAEYRGILLNWVAFSKENTALPHAYHTGEVLYPHSSVIIDKSRPSQITGRQ